MLAYDISTTDDKTSLAISRDGKVVHVFWDDEAKLVAELWEQRFKKGYDKAEAIVARIAFNEGHEKGYTEGWEDACKCEVD